MSHAQQQSLGGTVALVTGAGRGIGHATALALAARGARVAVGDIDIKAADAVAAEIGERAMSAPLDVANADSFAVFVALAEEGLGPVDVLVNNAGVMPLGRFHTQDDSVDERTLAINVAGVLRGMRLVLPAMLARGEGQIINVASAAGKAPTPGGLTYSASKAAVVAATETARVEYSGSGVEFTCVMPSFTNTELISGTKGTRFVSMIEPADVGEAIARAVVRPRRDVYVPRSVGAILWSYPIIGRKIRDGIARALGADKVFLEVDRGERASYDKREGFSDDPGSGPAAEEEAATAPGHPGGD